LIDGSFILGNLKSHLSHIVIHKRIRDVTVIAEEKTQKAKPKSQTTHRTESLTIEHVSIPSTKRKTQNAKINEHHTNQKEMSPGFGHAKIIHPEMSIRAACD